MKLSFKILITAIILFSFTACSTSKDQNTEAEKTDSKPTENVNSATGFISGTVTEIQPGKDGYTARIITEAGEEFYVTISRANLKAPETYRSVEVGETITIKGDQWQMENQNHITAREIKNADQK